MTGNVDVDNSFATNPSRSILGGLQYCLLNLTMQMFLQHDKITYRPCSRPGERVAPLPVTIGEKWVDSKYPVTCGIQQKLEALGYRLSWIHSSRLPSAEFEGCEVVIEKNRYGMLMSHHWRTNPESMVLVKKRRR